MEIEEENNMDDKILVTKEDGSEVELTILLTFENKELGYSYVFQC